MLLYLYGYFCLYIGLHNCLGLVMNKNDAKRILGVNDDSDDAELKSAFRFQCRKTHPDAGGSEEEFHKVSQAYNLLTGKSIEASEFIRNEQRAMQLAFETFMKRAPLSEQNNPIELSQKHLEDEIRGCQNKLNHINQELEWLSNLLNRVHHTSGEPFLTLGINNIINDKKQEIGHVKQEQSTIERAKELLSTVKWL